MISFSTVSDGNVHSFLLEVCTNEKDTYNWCITVKIAWYIEGMEDYSHRKNYPSSSHSFGVNKKKIEKNLVLRFLES